MTVLLIVTCASLALAAVTTLVAWRVTRDEQRRAAARVAALSADIRREMPMPAPIGPDRDHPAPVANVFTSADTFATADATRAPSRFATVIAAGAFVVCTAL